MKPASKELRRSCALVTGASSGIGAATAEALAEAGMDLILVARREERLKFMQNDLSNRFSVRVNVRALDIRSADAVAEFAKTADLRAVDVLVNNAGLAKGTDPMQSGNIGEWEQMIDTNIKGLLYLTRKVLPGMIESGRGHIVNLGSVAGRWVYPGGGVYCATKFAVRALSEGLRMDLLGTPIRVTNIEPGMVETEFSQVRFGSKEKAEAVYRGMRPLYPQDIAETILWCLTRPPHVNVQELVLFPTDQAAVHLVHRESPLGRA